MPNNACSVAVMGGPGTPCPAGGEFLRGQGIVIRCWVRNALIQHHGDIGAECGLDLNGFFWGQHVSAAIQMRLKEYAFLGKLTQTGQAVDLKPATIGENGTLPMHKTVQTTEILNERVGGP